MSLCSCRAVVAPRAPLPSSTPAAPSATLLPPAAFATHTHIVTYLSRTRKTIAGVAGGGCYRRENTWNAPEIYVEFTEVLYAAESRASRFLRALLLRRYLAGFFFLTLFFLPFFRFRSPAKTEHRVVSPFSGLLEYQESVFARSATSDPAVPRR